MKSGRYIGVMSGTSLDGVDVVLAAIDENMVARQASLTSAYSCLVKRRDPEHLPGTTADAFPTGPTGCASGGAVC